MEKTKHRLLGKLEFSTELGCFLGDTRIRLLEAIERLGSISQAAKAVPLSYKAAWDAIDAMNNLTDQPLVIRTTGGKHGGGTELTPYGRKIVALYRALEADYLANLERLSATLDDDKTDDVVQFQQLLKRMTMQTSARNHFVGVVTGLRQGEIDFEVRLRLDADSELVAVITRDSATSLRLQIGSEIIALIKSSSVLLLTDPEIRTSARNHLWGEITRIDHGPVNSEVSLVTPGGKNICAVVTQESSQRLELEVGQPACAVFQASDVILCLYQ